MLREGIGKYFELKESSIGLPDIYLGGQICKVILENGVHAWALRSPKYVQEAIYNVQRRLEKMGESLPSRAETPIYTAYCPELDILLELDPTNASYYLSLIGILHG